MMEYRHLIADPSIIEVGESYSSNKFGRLMKGLKGGIKGTETMQFMQKHEVPHDKTFTYARFMSDYLPQQEEKEQTGITVRGDRLDYQGEVSTKTSGLTTIKLLLNSVISFAVARFMTADVNKFFLNTPMKDPQYMRIPVKLTPNEI